jgi:hypothetical protein
MFFNRIDFTTEKPFWVNGDFSWYFDEYLQKYIRSQQENLPPLKNLNACICHNAKTEVKDYLLVDNQQKIMGNYRYTSEGFEQMIAKINILKVSKQFDNE